MDFTPDAPQTELCNARHLSVAEGTNQIQALLMAQSVLGLSAIK